MDQGLETSLGLDSRHDSTTCEPGPRPRPHGRDHRLRHTAVIEDWRVDYNLNAHTLRTAGSAPTSSSEHGPTDTRPNLHGGCTNYQDPLRITDRGQATLATHQTSELVIQAVSKAVERSDEAALVVA